MPQLRANSIEHFLVNLNTSDSRGIPVGPYASNLLAELCLDDIDKRLLSKGIEHVRYVDDIRAFFKKRPDAEACLRDLTSYLHSSHRLSIQTYKTRIIKCGEMHGLDTADDPQEEEDRTKQANLQQMIDDYRENTGYRVTESDLPSDNVEKAIRDSIKELFEGCMVSMTDNYRMIRYLLRRAASLRLRSLYPTIRDSFNDLGPVIRDVCQYLDATLPKKPNGAEAKRTLSTIMEIIQGSEVSLVPFVKMWLLDLITNNPQLTDANTAMTPRARGGARTRFATCRLDGPSLQAGDLGA